MLIRASLGRMVCRKRRIESAFAFSDLVAVGTRVLSLSGYRASPMMPGYHTISNRLSQRENAVKPFGWMIVRSFNSKLKLPPDVVEDVRTFEVVTGDANLLDQNIKSAEAELNTRNEEEAMKIEFDRDFKPLLLPSCLLIPCSLDDNLTAFLHGQTHSIIKHEPLYLSALDVMTNKENMLKEMKDFFVSFIINERVMVTEEWNQSYGDIEMSVYDIAADGPDFYRGETDASFVESADKKKDGLAKLSAVLWKNSQVIWAKVYENVKCRSVNDAEVLAALALQLKCVELGFVKKLKHFTDSGFVVNVITGKHTIEMSDPQRGVYMLLRSLKGKFETLIAALRPRELMFLPDALLRCDGIPTGPMVKEILNQWQPHLKGAPLFRIYQNKMARNIIKTFGERANRYKDKVDSIYYLGVKNEQKFDVLMQLISTLSPDRLYVVIDKFEEKPLEFQKLVSEYLPELPLKEGTSSTFWLNNLKRKQSFGVMPEEKNGQPIEKKTSNAAEGTSVGKEEPLKRRLYVVFDASVLRQYYFPDDSCVIILTEPHELDCMKNTGIKEISTATFVRFHGVAHKKVVLKKKKEKDGKNRRRGKKGSEHGGPDSNNVTGGDNTMMGHGDPGRSYGTGRQWMEGEKGEDREGYVEEGDRDRDVEAVQDEDRTGWVDEVQDEDRVKCRDQFLVKSSLNRGKLVECTMAFCYIALYPQTLGHLCHALITIMD